MRGIECSSELKTETKGKKFSVYTRMDSHIPLWLKNVALSRFLMSGLDGSKTYSTDIKILLM